MQQKAFSSVNGTICRDRPSGYAKDPNRVIVGGQCTKLLTRTEARPPSQPAI